MKKQILFILALLFPLMAQAQTDGYDPVNPPQPNWPEGDNTKYYQISCEAIPAGAGSFGGYAFSQQKAGSSVYVSASDHNGCYFHEWKDAEGNTLTTNRDYYFTMPGHNVTLYAIYSYDPDSPIDPQLIGYYQLSLNCDPEVACTFNFSNQKVQAASIQNLYAYANSGFRFLYWTNEAGEIIGNEYQLKYLMPAHASTLTAHFTYEPEAPINPGTNSWEKLSGEMIVDDFDPGSLNSTMQSMTGSNNYSQVTHLTVDGRMSNNDFGFTNYFKKLTFIDLSRVDGITSIPSYTWDGNTDLQEIEIPECITYIGSFAFQGCSALRAFNCYAPVPPTLENDVFMNVKEDMVVFVPESSVEIYQQANGWKNFTIAPLNKKILELTIHDSEASGKHKNLVLELVNLKSGQKKKFHITNSEYFSFPNLVRNTIHKLYLKNPAGQVFAETDTIRMDDDKELEASQLWLFEKHAARTQVYIYRENEDVTMRTNIMWMDPKGNYLAKGSTLLQQLPGSHLMCYPELDEKLAKEYLQPDTIDHKVVDADNDPISIHLKPIPKVQVYVNIIDAITGKALPKVNATITSTYASKYTTSSQEDINGKNVVFDKVPTRITVTASGYISQTWETDGKEWGQQLTIEVQPLEHQTTLNLDLTYHSASDPSEQNTVQAFHDFNNISYALYNVTKDATIKNFEVNGTTITIFDKVDNGDSVTVFCESLDKTFVQSVGLSKPGCSIKQAQGSVKLALLEMASLKARFLVTDNTAVDALLYNNSGKLVQSGSYANFNPKALEGTDANNIEFTHLVPGYYTLITLGHSDFFNSIYDLDKFENLGLQEDVDYVKNEFTIGTLSNVLIRNVIIPLFDESKFYYTGVNTAFSVNKSNVIQGNYLTLNTRLDFLDDVKDHVSDIELVFPLPESAEMVEGSLMRGKEIAEYQYENHTVTLHMGENYTDRVKFCIVPTERGNYTPTAYVRFKLDNHTITQPIGSAPYTVTDITMWTPKLISTPTLFVQGNAPSHSDVTVYADGYPIGETKALSDGYWQLEADLPFPTNLSMTQVYAQIQTPAGIELQTEYRFVEYNEQGIQAKDVEMTFFNDLIGVKRTIFVGFDLERYKTTSPSYMFQAGTEFVFTANLTNNDPQIVHSCTIRVFTNNHEWIELPAQYIPNLDRWVAHSKFTIQSMPIGVRVEVDADLSEDIDIKKSAEEWKEMMQHQVNVKPEHPMATINTNDFVLNLTQMPTDEEGIQWQFFMQSDANVDLSTFTTDTIVMPTTETGDSIRIFVANDNSFIVLGDNSEGKAWGVRAIGSKPAGAPRKARINTELTTVLKEYIAEFSTATNYILPYTNWKNLSIMLAEAKNSVDFWEENPPSNESQLENQKIALRRYSLISKVVDNVDNIMKLVRNANTLLSYAHYSIEDVNEWQAFSDRILPCNGIDDPQARALSWNSQANMMRHGYQYIRALEIAAMAIRSFNTTMSAISDKNLYWFEKEELKNDEALLFILNFSPLVMTDATDVFLNNKAASRNHIRKAKRDKNRYTNCNYDYVETIDPKWDFSLPYPVVEPIIDPSGYVYEGVSSNRLEGVTATAYYKHRYEDMYGDLHEEIVKWDAENYGQENPLLTDEKGMYQWDVPQGTWRVKFEKEGYQTAYSDWLPVPPPQLDVNVAMTQLTQPEVTRARAFEAGTSTPAGVEVTFSKFMKPELLNAEHIFIKGVKNNDETLLDGLTFTYPDKEAAVEGSNVEYTQKVFVATDKLNDYDEAYIIVDALVESYAGVPLTQPFQQKLDIERQLTSIAVEEEVDVAYEGQQTLKVAVLPTEAAAGKQVSIITASTKVATLQDEKLENIVLTLDADGQAEFIINGELFGTTALQFEVIDEELSAQTLVNVVDAAFLTEVKAPTASRISGTAVYRGQTVNLTCETEGATIYYTTDGTCPCESATRKVYQIPIVINEAMTLKVMSVGYNGGESEVREYNYLIRQSSLSLDLAEGWNWISHDLASPLAVSELQNFATEVLTPTDSPALQASQAAKVKTAAATSQNLMGEQYNPAGTVITLNEGWNWMGYPVDQLLTLTDALAYLNVEEGDFITNLEGGYSEYVNGKWTGLLKTMKPGQGYLYKSASEKNFIYNAVPTQNAHDIERRKKLSENPWNINPHAYPNLMPMTAELYFGDSKAADDAYFVGAFCGDECRGVAQFIDGLLFISIHGTCDESIQLIAIDRETEERTVFEQQITFQSDPVGSVKAPYRLFIEDLTGVSDHQMMSSDDVYNLTGQKVNPQTARHGIYIVGGKKVLLK